MCCADNLVLLAPSPSAQRLMLRCCEAFACYRGLRLNAPKMHLIHFSSLSSVSCSSSFYFCSQ